MRYYYPLPKIPDTRDTRALAKFGTVCTALAWGALGILLLIVTLGALIGLLAPILGVDL